MPMALSRRPLRYHEGDQERRLLRGGLGVLLRSSGSRHPDMRGYMRYGRANTILLAALALSGWYSLSAPQSVPEPPSDPPTDPPPPEPRIKFIDGPILPRAYPVDPQDEVPVIIPPRRQPNPDELLARAFQDEHSKNTRDPVKPPLTDEERRRAFEARFISETRADPVRKARRKAQRVARRKNRK